MPVGNLNADPIENFNSRTRSAGGCRKNPSTRDYPAAFATSLIKDITGAEIKKKNCEADEAEHFIHLDTLLDLAEKERVLPALEDLQVTAAATGEEVEEEDCMDEEDDVEEEDEIEEVREVHSVTSDDFSRRVQEKLGAAIGAHTAAPVVAAYTEKWQCEECSCILQSPTQFPLHILSTMASTSSSCNQKLPSLIITQVTQVIYEEANKQLTPNITAPNILQNFISNIEQNSTVKKLNLCAAHKDQKKFILKAIARKALEDILLVLNQEYRAKKKRGPNKSTKLQMVSHM